MSDISPALPTFRQALRVWLRIGVLSFGGPAGQIALLHAEVVDRHRWVSDRRFLHALNFCTVLPGPEAMQLATYLGWLMHGPLGGLAAGGLFVLPGAVVMLALSVLYATLGGVKLVAALFLGLQAAVLVLVLQALLRIGRRALKTRQAWALALAAFLALFLFAVPFPAVVLAAGLVGALLPGVFAAGAHGTAADGPPAALDAVLAADPGRAPRMAAKARRAGMIALLAWAVPLFWLLPGGGRFADIGWFFSKMAVVTFGGAYAVLAYVAQDAVQAYHWLSASDMLAGLGLAETTPGPLILVLQFVGFLAGYHAPGPLHGLAGGIAASVLTLWVTFVPCFAFVFLGAPLIEQLHDARRLSGAMGAITAAVVGVIGNLTVWFALQTLFTHPVPVGLWGMTLPVPDGVHWPTLGLAVLAAVLTLGLKQGIAATLALCAAASVVLTLLGGI